MPDAILKNGVITAREVQVLHEEFPVETVLVRLRESAQFGHANQASVRGFIDIDPDGRIRFGTSLRVIHNEQHDGAHNRAHSVVADFLAAFDDELAFLLKESTKIESAARPGDEGRGPEYGADKTQGRTDLGTERSRIELFELLKLVAYVGKRAVMHECAKLRSARHKRVGEQSERLRCPLKQVEHDRGHAPFLHEWRRGHAIGVATTQQNLHECFGTALVFELPLNGFWIVRQHEQLEAKCRADIREPFVKDVALYMSEYRFGQTLLVRVKNDGRFIPRLDYVAGRG